MFDVLMTGVGDAFSRQHWGTSFLLERERYLLAVDCPDSYRRALLESGFERGDEPIGAEHLDAMLLTHLHGDHVNGLEMTACYLRFAHERRLKVYTTPEAAEELWARLRPSLGRLWDGEDFHAQALEDFLDVEVLEWGEPTQIGPFEVVTRPTQHHLPAMAMRVRDGGAELGYSCDTAWDEELVEWLFEADFVIHESAMGAAHTPLERLMELPEERRERMIVVHYPDELVGAQLLELELARQGARYPISARDASP